VTAQEMITQLERFDPRAPVVVLVNEKAIAVGDVGLRDRPFEGAHPLIYLQREDSEGSLTYPDTSMPSECEGHQCDWRGGPIHAPGCPLYKERPMT
jgi:hypothetical protein